MKTLPKAHYIIYARIGENPYSRIFYAVPAYQTNISEVKYCEDPSKILQVSNN